MSIALTVSRWEPGERGEPIVDDTLLLILNAAEEPIEFALPNHEGRRWQLVFDTISETMAALAERRELRGGSALRVAARSTVLLLLPRA